MSDREDVLDRARRFAENRDARIERKLKSHKITPLSSFQFAVQSGHGGDVLVWIEEKRLRCEIHGTSACDHNLMVKRFLQEGQPAELQPEERVRRVQTPRDWPFYKLYRRIAPTIVEYMLHDLCGNALMEERLKGEVGRPELLIHDVVQCVNARRMVRGSGLEADPRVREYHRRGWLLHPESPHEDTISMAMRDPRLYDQYVRLVELVADLFASTEKTFLIDGQFYRTPAALFEVELKDPNDKKKTIKRRAQFIKLVPVLCVDSKIVATYTIFNEEQGENSQTIPLFKRVRMRFRVLEVACADALYSDAAFRQWLEDNKIEHRIPFRDNAVPNGKGLAWDHDLDAFLNADDTWWAEYLVRLTVESYFAALMRNNGNVKKLKSKTFESLKIELSSLVLNYQLRMAFIAYLRGTIDIPWLGSKTRDMMDRLRTAYLSKTSLLTDLSTAG